MRRPSNLKNKIISFAQLTAESQRLQSEGKRIVATNGCFDILHVGHVRYLAAAKGQGDVLVVGLNGDKSVRQLKGAGRPVNREQDRAEVLAAVESVDYVVIFPETRATKFLAAARPDVYVKGGDYTAETLDAAEREVLEKTGSKIEIIPFEPGYSTSELLERIKACGS
jgi:rfaE bifunctional protein nucleotidyltransferase chain/domain